jgi:peroxiredoxin/outer membrane lipoprotein-sorting protein
MTDRAAFSKKSSSQDGPSSRKTRKGVFTRWISAACVVASLLAARTAFSATPRVGDILRKMGSAYSHLQSYHIEAVREDVFLKARVGSSQRSVITLDADGKGRVRVRLTGGGPNVLIVNDGKTIWHYAYRKKRYTERKRIPAAVGPHTPRRDPIATDLLGQIEDLLVHRYVRLWRFERQATFKGVEPVEFQGRKTPCYRVVFHLKDLTDRLWIDQSSYLVLQEKSVQTIAGAERRSLVSDTIRISEFGMRASHAPDFFTFTPPGASQRVAALNLPGIREGFAGAGAKDFTLKDIEGRRVSLSHFRGKTVLLSFWATWCSPCKEELPTLQKIFEERKDVVVLTVDDENKATIRNFLKDKHYGFTALMDRKRTLFKQFAVHFIPTVFVINQQGLIIREIVGWKGPEELMAALKAAQHQDTSPGGLGD